MNWHCMAEDLLVDLARAAACGRAHRRDHLTDTAPDPTPSALAQIHNGDFMAGEILLTAQVLVGRDEHFEPGGLGFIQQLADSQPRLNRFTPSKNISPASNSNPH